MASADAYLTDGRRRACPGGATTDGPADNRRSTGTSPVAAITSRCNTSGCQSPGHGDKPRGAGYAAEIAHIGPALLVRISTYSYRSASMGSSREAFRAG